MSMTSYEHLQAKHITYVYSDLNYFESLKENFAKRSTINTLFITQTAIVGRSLEAG